MTTLMGIPPAQAIGRRAPELIGSAVLAANADGMAVLDVFVRDILAGGSAVEDDDGTMRDASGHVVDSSVRLQPVLQDGEVVGVLFAIRGARTGSSLMFRNSSVAMVHLDPLGGLREANHAFLKLVGLSEDHVRQHNLHDFVHSDDVDASTSRYAALVAGEVEAYHAEQRFIRGDGSTVWTKVSVGMERRAAERARWGVALVEDISERKRLEAELDEVNEREASSREQFESAFDHAPIGVVLADSRGRFIKVNPALHDMLGYAPGTLEGRHSSCLVHPADADIGAASLKSLVAGDEHVARFEKRYVRVDGSDIWVSVNVTLVHVSDGRDSHFLAHLQDVTERRNYEQQLREQADRDPLTGLLNRRSFERELNRHGAEVHRYGPDGALLLLDLDHLKSVNDTLGHRAGDELIVLMARLLKGGVRATDHVARLGGDEFAVLIPKGDLAAAVAMADNLLRAIREHTAVLNGAAQRVTASIGLAVFDGTQGVADDVLIAADLAMYRAKAAGRDRWAGPTST